MTWVPCRDTAEWLLGSGGSSASSGFFDNPQFALMLSAPTDVLITINTQEKIAVNARLFAAGGERVFGFGVTEVRLSSGPVMSRCPFVRRVCGVRGCEQLATSGDYRGGFCYLIKREVPAGRYTIIASSYRADAAGPLTVMVGSSRSDVKLAVIPASGGYTALVGAAAKVQWEGGLLLSVVLCRGRRRCREHCSRVTNRL